MVMVSDGGGHAGVEVAVGAVDDDDAADDDNDGDGLVMMTMMMITTIIIIQSSSSPSSSSSVSGVIIFATKRYGWFGFSVLLDNFLLSHVQNRVLPSKHQQQVAVIAVLRDELFMCVCVDLGVYT